VRRLQGEISGHSGEGGVGVLMRYTLRLLTAQQFQRAATLVCLAPGSSTLRIAEEQLIAREEHVGLHALAEPAVPAQGLRPELRLCSGQQTASRLGATVFHHHLPEPGGVVVDLPLEAVADFEHLTGELAGQAASRSVVTCHHPSSPSIAPISQAIVGLGDGTRSTLLTHPSISATVGASL
jgi:hypothetical protein